MKSGNSYLPARILQGAGLTILFASVIFWGLTGRESVLLISAAMSLILLGAYGQAASTVGAIIRETKQSQVEQEQKEKRP